MLGLLASILSQTRRTLTKVLRIDTDYTTARAVKIDNLDTTISSRLASTASPSGNIQTDAQNGVNAQGYTTTRASNLDNLDTTVSSRLADSNAVARVQSGLNANGYTTTVSGRIDTTVSSRRPKAHTRPVVSATTSSIGATIVSVSGAGILHGISNTGTGFVSVSTVIIIDGVTVATLLVNSSTGVKAHMTADGTKVDDNTGASNFFTPELGWEFSTSLVVQHGGANNLATHELSYSLE